MINDNISLDHTVIIDDTHDHNFSSCIYWYR